MAGINERASQVRYCPRCQARTPAVRRGAPTWHTFTLLALAPLTGGISALLILAQDYSMHCAACGQKVNWD